MRREAVQPPPSLFFSQVFFFFLTPLLLFPHRSCGCVAGRECLLLASACKFCNLCSSFVNLKNNLLLTAGRSR